MDGSPIPEQAEGRTRQAVGAGVGAGARGGRSACGSADRGFEGQPLTFVEQLDARVVAPVGRGNKRQGDASGRCS